jgi:hypothetical protein
VVVARNHIVDGKVVQGRIIQRKCTAQIIIYPPLNNNVRKAPVIPVLGRPHNHPSYAPEKLSFEAAEAWREAVRIAGPLGKTISDILRGIISPVLVFCPMETNFV